MRRRDAGLILLSAGVLCGIIYILLKLGGDSSVSTQTTNLLMYSGIVTIIAGLIVFGTSERKAYCKNGKVKARISSNSSNALASKPTLGGNKMGRKRESNPLNAALEAGREALDQTTQVAGEVISQASNVAASAVEAAQIWEASR